MLESYGEEFTVAKKQEQIKDKAYSYGTIGIVLSALESYANHFSANSNVFNAYDNFNTGLRKTSLQLKHQIISQLHVLHSSQQMYRRKYNKYDFPVNLSQQEMINYINSWKSKVPPEDKKYYDAVIQILDGQSPNLFIHELGTDAKVNPAFLAGTSGIMNEAQQIGERALLDYNQRGIEPQINLNAPYHGSENFNRAGQQELQRQAANNQLDNLLDQVDNILSQMQSSSNAQSLVSTYNNAANSFINGLKSHITTYQNYWYHNNKKEHDTKVKSIQNKCTSLSPKSPQLFEQLRKCLG